MRLGALNCVAIVEVLPLERGHKFLSQNNKLLQNNNFCCKL